MVISSPLPFDLIYIPVLIFCTGLFSFSGKREGYSVPKTVGSTVFLMVLFVLGIKIISYPVNEWKDIFSNAAIHELHVKYLPGGILFIALGLFFLRFFLKIRLSYLDFVVLGLPLVGILQRIDCLMSGCCYGKPTHLPWAIHYTDYSAAYKQQLADGLISTSEVSSLGIHPTQVYYIISYVIVFVILIALRKKIRAPGNLALSGIILMAISRFIIEFFRQPVLNSFSSVNGAGLNLLQWMLVLIILITSTVLFIRENRPGNTISALNEPKDYLWRSSFLILVSAILVWNASRILTMSEYIFLQVITGGSVLVLSGHIFFKTTVTAARYRVLAVLALTILIMSQKSKEITLDADTLFTPKNWWSVKASIAGGEYNQVNKDCNGNVVSTTKQQYQIINGGFSYNYMPVPYQHLQAGLNLGNFKDNGNSLFTPDSSTINYINPFVKYDFKYVGFGLGYHFLQSVDFYGLPSIFLRGGNLDKWFFDAGFMDNFSMVGLPGSLQFGVGTGFGNSYKHVLRFGVSAIEGRALGYAEGNFLLADRFNLQTALGIGNTIHGMIGFQYSFGKNRLRTQMK